MAAAVTSAARQAPARGGSAKTSPPELPRDYVNRARLLDRLDAALSRRLTTVVAGPGYGKTTLLAAWAAHHGAAWYTVDSRGRSLGRFARGLCDTLGLLRAPELGQPGSDTRADALAELLCEAVATCLEADTALILDDVRELSAKRASARLLETLCRQAPEQLHVVIGSRREPPFPIQRLRGRGHVLSIDADALALTPFTVLTKSLPDGDYALVTRINVDFELTMDDGDGYCQRSTEPRSTGRTSISSRRGASTTSR